MDIRKVKKLIELLEESGIAEIEITEGEEAVRISRYAQSPAGAPPPQYYATAPAMPMPAAAPATIATPRTAKRMVFIVDTQPVRTDAGSLTRAAQGDCRAGGTALTMTIKRRQTSKRR